MCRFYCGLRLYLLRRLCLLLRFHHCFGCGFRLYLLLRLLLLWFRLCFSCRFLRYILYGLLRRGNRDGLRGGFGFVSEI